MKFYQDLCLNLWYELNPRVRYAFGNVYFGSSTLVRKAVELEKRASTGSGLLDGHCQVEDAPDSETSKFECPIQGIWFSTFFYIPYQKLRKSQ